MDKPRWETLLEEAVNKPGSVHACYTRFHGYSVGNQMLALWECWARGIEPGPISTYRGWQSLGRQVKAGEKAISLWMPVTVTEKDEETGEDSKKTVFVFKPRWFVLGQTEGDGVVPEPPDLGDWSLERALNGNAIDRAPFNQLNGNIQGYASGHSIAVSPLAVTPVRTGIHEAAHVLLGHTADGVAIVDGAELARNLEEVEAESVVLIVMDALGLDGQEFSRGYIQSWWGLGNAIPEASARRIFTVADRLLRSGYESAAVAKAA